MQQKMIQATVLINKFIIKHNKSNSMPTPKLAKKIIKKAGKQKKTPLYYAKLIDGIHPNENTSEDWINQISMAIRIESDKTTSIYNVSTRVLSKK